MSKTPAKIYGLIGYPVEHSFSPLMHNAAFSYLGMDAAYRLFPLPPEQLADFFQKDILLRDTEGNQVRAKEIRGFNVTVPHKERVLDFVSLEGDSAYLQQIRAINTVVRQDNRCQGFNTDIAGFRWHLLEKNFFSPQGKQVALLGAGGAARAVTYVLAKAGAGRVVVFDLERQKVQGLVKMIKGLFPEFSISGVDSLQQLEIPEKDLLINATPVGLRESDPCLVKAEMLHKGIFVYDLIYNPLETKLLALAKKQGAVVSNGLGMLQYQGVLSFQHFTKAQVQQEQIFKVMGQALREGINRR